MAHERTLLILDGVEPLQHPPGPMGGKLRAPGVEALLRQFAAAGQPGLCVVTTRQRITDIEEYERSVNHPAGSVITHELANLGETEGGGLLYRLGIRRAGMGTIGEDDAELRAASRQVRGLALALTWWSVAFPSSKEAMVGDSTMNLQKFEDGWKIVASHTSVAGM
jgi:hypothetical protein